MTHRFEPSSGSSRTCLVLPHGTGGDESDLVPLVRRIAAKASLLGIRGSVTEGGVRRYFRRSSEGLFDEQDVARRAHELAGFIEAATSAYARDPERLVALGYSNGANMAAALLPLEPQVLSEAILLRTALPLEPPQLPHLVGKRVLWSSGQADAHAPPAKTLALVAWLRQSGATVDHHYGGVGMAHPGHKAG